MPEVPSLHFGPYRLAGPQGPLFRGSERLKLKPKALSLLWELAQHAGEVVTKAALRNALWSRSVVGEDAIAFQVQALRRVLQDDARQPRYIATCHRVGYSFVASVTLSASPVLAPVDPPVIRLAAADPKSQAGFVGREGPLARVNEHYARTLRGERQLVFISGDAGIGKTRLVDRFLEQVGAAPRIGHGQCVEQHGVGEGYLPVLEALGALCRQPKGHELTEVLRQMAPTWLMQLPALLLQDDLLALQARVMGATRERMLREISDALEAITAERPLVLVLEDLHWSDPSTLDMLSLLARRTGQARLLVLCTYRANALAANPALQIAKQELVARTLATEIALGNLLRADVQAYLAQRFPGAGDPAGMSAFVFRRTEGHPLFMVQLADYLAQTETPESPVFGVEALETVVPQGLRELIEVQLGRLSAGEQRLLQMASVVGAEFTVASASAAARMPLEEAETCCERLAQHGQFIEGRGLATWPDGTVSGRFGFGHVLYQEVLYARLSARQRAQAHLAIGLREETGYAGDGRAIAAELAVHFERGQSLSRAVDYRQQAGENALQRSANDEAVEHFTQALGLLARLPATDDRAHRELRLLGSLSLGLTMTKGYSVPEVERVNARALEICQQMDETPELSPILFRIERFHLVRGDLRAARGIGDMLLRIARATASSALLSQAHTASGFEFFSLGDFSAARRHAEQCIAHDDPKQYQGAAVVSADDSSAVSYAIHAFALQILGYSDQAKISMQNGVALARELNRSFAEGGALLSMADFHLMRRESRAVHAWADAAIAHSVREGLPYYVARATVLRGWTLAEQGHTRQGIAEIREGLAAFEATGAGLWLPCCLGLLAEAHGWHGEFDEGLRCVAEALQIADATGERQYEAELHRLSGELRLQKSPQDRVAAEGCFHRAIAVARHQDAKTYELRATMSLARSSQRTGKIEAVRERLHAIVGWFTEGFDTNDLQAAKALLSEVASTLPS